MCSDNTLSILPESVYGYLLLNSFTFNIKNVCKLLHYGLALFFAWAGLFWLEKTRKDPADVF